MAERNPPADLRAFLLPDDRFSVANLTAKGSGSLDSAYTETGPRPGVPDPSQSTSMALQSSGDQSADGSLVVRCLRAGHPGFEEAGIGWRRSADATSAVYGWDAPSLVTGWQTLYYSTSAVGREIWPDVIRLQSGKLLGVYNVSTLGVVQISLYTPSAGTWASVNLTPTGAGTGYVSLGVTLTQLPSGRILAFCCDFSGKQIDQYYSDDEGTTWTAGARRCLRVSVPYADIRTIRARYGAGEILLLICYYDGSNSQLRQYASDDLGARFFDQGAGATGHRPRYASIVPLRSGGFYIAFSDVGSGYKRAPIASAFSSVADATYTTLLGATSNAISLYDDEDAVLFLLYQNITGNLAMLRSADGGSTWSAFAAQTQFDPAADVSGPTATDSLREIAAHSVAGRTALLTRWTAGTSTLDAQSVGVIWLGGWSTHTAPYSTNQTTFQDTEGICFGVDDRSAGSSGLDGAVWLPIEEPGDNNWTAAGAGTDALSSGLLAIDTVAGQRNYTRLSIRGTVSYILGVFVEVALKVDAGTGDDSTEQIAVNVRLTDRVTGAGNGTYDYAVSLRFDGAGFSLYDRNGASLIDSAVVLDMTTIRRFRILLDAFGNVKCWYSTSGTHARSWTAGPDATALTNNGVTAQDRSVAWGHLANTTAGSDWEMVGFCFWAGQASGAQTGRPAATWTNPTDLHPKSISSIPQTVSDGVRVAAVDGPAYLGEQWTIDAIYDYPVDVVLPAIDPCPRVRWRNLADEIDVTLVFDLVASGTEGRLLNTSIGLVVLGANVANVLLDYWTGSAWVNVCEARSTEGWSSLPYARDGDVVYVNPGVSASSAWIRYGEHIGAAFQLDATTFRVISAHSEGAWEDSTTKRPWVRLAGILGTEPATGTGAILAKDFGVVVHEKAINARYWRIKIPSQVTVAGYYEIGQILVGGLVVLGYQYSRGWSIGKLAQVEQSGWRDGQSRVRKLAPSARTYEIAWTDGTDGAPLRASSASPDYVAGSNGGLPIAARADGPRLIEGLLQATDGPRRPVVLLPRVVRATGDQRFAGSDSLIWGRLGNEIARDHALGDELVSEVERTSKVVLTELV